MRCGLGRVFAAVEEGRLGLHTMKTHHGQTNPLITDPDVRGSALGAGLPRHLYQLPCRTVVEEQDGARH